MNVLLNALTFTGMCHNVPVDKWRAFLSYISMSLALLVISEVLLVSAHGISIRIISQTEVVCRTSLYNLSVVAALK